MKTWEIHDAQVRITEAGLENSATRLVPPNSVLVVVRSGVLKHTVPVAINRAPVAINQDMKALLCAESADPGYVARFIKARSPVILQWVRATTADNFPIDKLKRLQIPLPPLPEQRRIAEALDKADALRAKRRAALAQLDTLAQSIFLDMFGDPATNPKGWPRKALQEVFDIARGGSPRPIDDFVTDSPDGINWIMIGDASEGSKYITRTKKRIKPEGAQRSRTVKPGDLLLTNSMSFGRPYIMRTNGCIHDGWLVLSPRGDEVDPDYFYTLLGSRAVFAEFVRRAPGATVKNLNIELVRGVTVPVAPVARQKEYARAVAVAERAKEPFEKSLERLDDLIASLQCRAFRGDLVREEVIEATV